MYEGNRNVFRYYIFRQNYDIISQNNTIWKLLILQQKDSG